MAKEKKGKIITVTSMKGGVGKTIFTLLLASVYENLGKKVLIIDLDLHAGDIAFCLNAEILGTIYNVCDDMNNNRYRSITSSDYLCHYDDFIDILAAPKDPRYASKVDKRCLDLLLGSISNYYDVVLIDTNHLLDIYNMLAFEYSNKIVDIFTNDSMDLKSTKTFVSICRNVDVDNYCIVLNESIRKDKTYFSEYSVKSFLGRDIDYFIPSNLSIQDIDQDIMDSKLFKNMLSLNKKSKKTYESLANFALSLLSDAERGTLNEKE